MKGEVYLTELERCYIQSALSTALKLHQAKLSGLDKPYQRKDRMIAKILEGDLKRLIAKVKL